MKIKIFILFILITLYLIPSTTTQAASFDLSVSPPIFQVELKPPAVADVKEQITLENTGDDPMDLSIVFLPFRQKGENGEVEYLKDGVGGEDPLIFQRISLQQDGKRIEEIHIPPKTTRKLDFVISIPKDSPPSDYYFTVLFVSADAVESEGLNPSSNGTRPGLPAGRGLTPESNSDEVASPQGSRSVSSGGVGMNVLLSVGPKTTTKGAIEEFSTDLFRTEGPVPFTVKIRNDSSHFIYPEANIVIKNMFGQTIGKVDLLPVNILSNSTRALPSREQFALTAQETDSKSATKKPNETIQKLVSNPEQPTAIWPERLLIGPYRATLTVALSEEGPLYVRTITFIGLPIHILIAFGVMIVFLLVIRNRLKHRKKY